MNVEVVFIAHSTTGKVVTELEFFHKVESGGTYISSGYEKALEIIDKRYNPSFWNIYAFHASDGDNWSEDDDKAVEYAKKLCDVCNLFGYTEIMPASYMPTIRRKFENRAARDNFVISAIKSKDDVWPAFRNILKKELKEG